MTIEDEHALTRALKALPPDPPRRLDLSNIVRAKTRRRRGNQALLVTGTTLIVISGAYGLSRTSIGARSVDQSQRGTGGTIHSSQIATSVSDQDREAMALCRSALKEVVWARSTLVRNVRSMTVGPGDHPGAGAFPGAKPSDSAAWCWTDAGPAATANVSPAQEYNPQESKEHYVFWAVSSVGPPLELAQVDSTSVPNGPATVP